MTSLGRKPSAGLSRSACGQKMSGVGIPWSTNDDQRLGKLAQSGLSFAEIARQMNRSRSVIRNHAEKLKIAVAKGQAGKPMIVKGRPI